jgi:hypothetical protein
MLVLSRKKNESIVINNDITIVVVEIRGDKSMPRKGSAFAGLSVAIVTPV